MRSKFLISTVLLSVLMSFLHAQEANYSLSFDGSDDYLDVSDNSTLRFTTGSITYQCWFKKTTEALSTAPNLITNYKTSTSGLFGLYIESDGKVQLHYRNSDDSSEKGIKSSSSVLDNSWHHAVGVKDASASKIYIYIDGSLNNEASVTIGDTDSNQGLIIGSGHLGRYMEVIMDEVSVWNDALTATEVTALYNSGSPINAASNSGDYTSSENLQGYWRMNEGTGSTVADDSDNSNTATLSGASWSSTVPDYSLSFDGSNDYISVTNNLAGSYTAFTISTWVKVDDYGDNDPDFILDVGTSGNGRRINLSISTNGFNASLEGVGSNIFDVYASSSNTTDWQHVVFNWSGTDYARIFINGTQAAETTDISSGTLTLESGDSFNIGKRFSGAHYFPGDIDEMSIWNEALTSSEITALYNTGAGLDASSNSGNYTSSSNLIAYWKMDEGTGTTLSDATSNGNDGTINGATWSPDSPIMSFKTIVGNMYKVPYHHIEHYMHEAGVELISGTWTIVATDGKFDTYATNGPFTLTIDGSKLNIEDGDIIPESFALHANYPNPFNPTTTISYDLPKRSQVTLGIYDLLGKQIKTLVNQSQDAGNKIAVWDGTNNLGRQVSAGVYLYQIQAGEFTQTRKMLFLK